MAGRREGMKLRLIRTGFLASAIYRCVSLLVKDGIFSKFSKVIGRQIPPLKSFHTWKHIHPVFYSRKVGSYRPWLPVT